MSDADDIKDFDGKLKGAVAKGISSLASENYRASGKICQEQFWAGC